MERTKLIVSGIPKVYCTEAIITAFYHINNCMIQSLLNKIPYKLLKGRKPNLARLKAFVCVCYVHNNGKYSLGK